MNHEGLPLVDSTLAGKYRLTRKIGQGGMGAVYEAEHLRLGQKVAAKVMLPEIAKQSETAYRFEYEARAAAKLRGRHTVRVLDVDTTPEGLHYLVMELLEGRSLRDELRSRGPLPVTEAVRYVREACEGVDEAHRAGIVHRDLKPANLFLSVEGGLRVIKVIDFGIAKAMGSADTKGQTATNAPLGTYLYMSPEQARSARSVDARTDVWSLGVVLYQLLTSKTPFDGEGLLGLIYAIATQAPAPLLSWRPDLPEALVAVIERALCKDREGRYPTMYALSQALAPFEGDFASLALPSSGLTATRPPALGLKVSSHELAHAPTQAFSHQAERAGLKPQALWPATLAFGSAPATQAPSESVSSLSKSHVLPLPAPSVGGRPPRSVWLVSGTIGLLFGGLITLGVKTRAGSYSGVSSLPLAALSEEASAIGRAPSAVVAPVAPDQTTSSSSSAASKVHPEGQSEAPLGVRWARGTTPSSLAPNASSSQPHQSKARRARPTTEEGHPAPNAKPPEPLEPVTSDIDKF
jgi:eukaryotic-like serine/threonine-protein kinase